MLTQAANTVLSPVRVLYLLSLVYDYKHYLVHSSQKTRTVSIQSKNIVEKSKVIRT